MRQIELPLPAGKNFYLGPYGTKASKVESDRFIAEWMSNGRQMPSEATDPGRC
jgi:hypothetical protein